MMKLVNKRVYDTIHRYNSVDNGEHKSGYKF